MGVQNKDAVTFPKANVGIRKAGVQDFAVRFFVLLEGKQKRHTLVKELLSSNLKIFGKVIVNAKLLGL